MLGALVAGPLVLIGYLAAWVLVPVDQTLPAGQRPSSAPRALMYLVAAIVAIQIAFGLVTNLPIGWMLLTGIAVYWFFVKD